MSRVLHTPALAGAPRVVAEVDPVVDPVVRALVDRAAEEAYRRGVADGLATGVAEGRRAADGLAAAVERAAAHVTAAVRDLRAEQADGTVELAAAIAAHVLDREPGDGGQALLRRVHDWLAQIDDRPVQLAVAADDAPLLTAALGDRPDVAVVTDAGLSAGEARLTGAWSQAELSRARRWDDVRRILDDA